MAVNLDNSFVIAWRDSTGYSDIYARKFDDHGQPLGDEFRVNSSLKGASINVATSASGQLAFAWETRNEMGKSQVVTRRFSSAGIPNGQEFIVSTSTDDSHSPRINSFGSSDWIIAWLDSQPSGSIVRARRFYAESSKFGDVFEVSTVVPNSTQFDSLETNYDGQSIAVWHEPNGLIHFSRLSTSGGLGADQRIVVPSLLDARAAIIDHTGKFVLIWARSNVFGGVDVYSQRFDQFGVPFEGVFRVNSTLFAGPAASSLNGMLADSDNFTLTWSGLNNGSQGVFAQHFFTDSVAPVVFVFKRHNQGPYTSDQWQHRRSNGSCVLNHRGQFLYRNKFRSGRLDLARRYHHTEPCIRKSFYRSKSS